MTRQSEVVGGVAGYWFGCLMQRYYCAVNTVLGTDHRRFASPSTTSRLDLYDRMDPNHKSRARILRKARGTYREERNVQVRGHTLHEVCYGYDVVTLCQVVGRFPAEVRGWHCHGGTDIWHRSI
jgi:hypothetical protein